MISEETYRLMEEAVKERARAYLNLKPCIEGDEPEVTLIYIGLVQKIEGDKATVRLENKKEGFVAKLPISFIREHENRIGEKHENRIGEGDLVAMVLYESAPEFEKACLPLEDSYDSIQKKFREEVSRN